jgi:hypothetical protein
MDVLFIPRIVGQFLWTFWRTAFASYPGVFLFIYICFVTLTAARAISCETIKTMDYNNAIDLRRSGQA